MPIPACSFDVLCDKVAFLGGSKRFLEFPSHFGFSFLVLLAHAGIGNPCAHTAFFSHMKLQSQDKEGKNRNRKGMVFISL